MGYPSLGAGLWLGSPDTLIDLMQGSTSAELAGTPEAPVIEALGRAGVIRQLMGLDHALTLGGIFDVEVQDDIEDAQAGHDLTMAYLPRKSGSNLKGLAGDLLVEGLTLAAGYTGSVIAQGGMPANGPWYLCDVTPFALNAGQNNLNFTVGSGFDKAFLVLTRLDATLTPTWTWGGAAWPLSAGATGIAARTAGTATVTVARTSGNGRAEGYILSGTEIAGD